MEQVVQALEAMNSPDNDSRSAAESWLSDIKQESLSDLMGAFAQILASTEYEPAVRSQAGLQLKNSVSGQHGHIRDIDRQNWSAVDEETRSSIKKAVLSTLGTEPSSPSTAAQVYSTIATIELEYWESALPDLLARLEGDADEDLLVAVLDAVGYMTGDITEINPMLLQPHSDAVLNTLIGAMADENSSARVQSASLKALTNSLEFCRSNFETPEERQYIIQSVGTLSTSKDERVAEEAIGCLSEIVYIYYSYIGDFMDAMNSVVNDQMMNEVDSISLAAIEFWSTIAERELESEESGDEHAGYCNQYLENVLPIVLQLLSRQDEDDDEDEFTVSKSASVCLGLLAEIVGDPIVDPTIDFVKENMVNDMWNLRDAAVMAFGGILSGPTQEKVAPIIIEAAIPIMNLIRDESTVVQDTVAWAIGRMTEMYPEVMLGEDIRNTMLECLAAALELEARVATNACWSLSNVIEEANAAAMEQLDPESGADRPASFLLSGDFETIMNMLISCTERDDVDASHLMEASFESLIVLIQLAPEDCLGYVSNYAPQAVERLRTVAQSEPSTPGQLKAMVALQGRLCSLVQMCISVLDFEVVQGFGNDFVEVLNHLLNQTSNAYEEIAEDALMAVSEVLRKYDEESGPYVNDFKDHIVRYIKNTSHGKTCFVAVGVLSDLVGCMQGSFIEFTQEFLALLMEVLAVPDLDRIVKPQVLSTIGDIAGAIGGDIVHDLPMVLQVLESVSPTAMEPISETADDDDVAFQNKLRENLIEAYTGVFQALTDANAKATPALIEISPNIGSFLETLSAICSDSQFSLDGIRLAAGFIGDCLRAFGSSIKSALSPDLIGYLLDKGRACDDPTVTNTVEWMSKHYANV